MALPASGQLGANLIMAEFGFPASTQWAMSTDGAAWINFAVGSQIAQSDFYNASASLSPPFTWSTESVPSVWQGMASVKLSQPAFFTPGSDAITSDGQFPQPFYPANPLFLQLDNQALQIGQSGYAIGLYKATSSTLAQDIGFDWAANPGAVLNDISFWTHGRCFYPTTTGGNAGANDDLRTIADVPSGAAGTVPTNVRPTLFGYWFNEGQTQQAINNGQIGNTASTDGSAIMVAPYGAHNVTRNNNVPGWLRLIGGYGPQDRRFTNVGYNYTQAGAFADGDARKYWYYMFDPATQLLTNPQFSNPASIPAGWVWTKHGGASQSQYPRNVQALRAFMEFEFN